jgi:enoyl-[acyl-carrier-protein] reductase (NADH)
MTGLVAGKTAIINGGHVAEVAAFLASDRAAGMTGTMADVTSGLVLR